VAPIVPRPGTPTRFKYIGSIDDDLNMRSVYEYVHEMFALAQMVAVLGMPGRRGWNDGRLDTQVATLCRGSIWGRPSENQTASPYRVTASSTGVQIVLATKGD
jgi:hypothetical protein